ncbi:hypothetical protein NUG22_26185, partial [Saccharothrix longispora]|nr:hypothetical protein [Saccharothrix longispora]
MPTQPQRSNDTPTIRIKPVAVVPEPAWPTSEPMTATDLRPVAPPAAPVLPAPVLPAPVSSAPAPVPAVPTTKTAGHGGVGRPFIPALIEPTPPDGRQGQRAKPPFAILLGEPPVQSNGVAAPAGATAPTPVPPAPATVPAPPVDSQATTVLPAITDLPPAPAAPA